MRRRAGSRWRREVDPLTGQEVRIALSEVGVEVRVAPLPGFRRRYAMLSARYGSLDTTLPDGTPLPAGTAHFLEHKMFQTPDGDVFDVFDERGASANAFTTHSATTYLFSCTRRFSENLDTLLQTLGEVRVDAESVEREKAIIGQEIAMWQDDPGWCGYLAAVEGLYHRHPVRIDTAGSVESIAKIDAGLLESVHGAFYLPKNLVLVVAGDLDPDRVLARVDAWLPSMGPGRRHRRRAASEPRTVAARMTERRMSVTRSHVWIGWKDTAPGGGARLTRRRVLSGLAVDVLFGDGGRVQAPLYREGMVDDTFRAAFEAEPDLAHLLVSAEVESSEVEKYRRRLRAEIARVAEEGITDAEVERTRRRALGHRLRVFNGSEPVAHWLLGTALEDGSADTGVAVLQGATGRSVTKRLRELVSRPRATAVVEPIETPGEPARRGR